MDGDTFYKDPFDDLYNLETFLRIPHKFNKDMYELTDGYYNVKNKSPRNPKTYDDYDPKSLVRMRELYAPHVKRTMELLGKRFAWETVRYVH